MHTPDIRLLIAGLLLLLPSLPAQVLLGGLSTRPGDPGGLFVLEPAATTPFQPILASLRYEQNPASMALDELDPRNVFVGTYGRMPDGSTGPCNVLSVRLDSAQITQVRRLNTNPLHEDFILAVVPIGDQIWYLGRYNLGAVPRGGGEARPVLSLQEWMDPRGMASDGRFLYIAFGATDIARIDIARPSEISLFTRLLEYPGEEIQGLGIDNAGDVLVVTSDLARGARLLALDRTTGTTSRALRLPLSGARSVAQDPESGRIYVVGGRTATRTSAIVVADWQVIQGPVGDISNTIPALVVMRPRSIYRIGVACRSPNGESAHLGMIGRASTQAPGFALTLRSGPGRDALLLVRAGEAGAAGIISLSPYGATGCSLLLDGYPLLFTRTDANGVAAAPFPRPPVLDQQILLAQWVVVAPGANALNLLTSEVGRIIIRE